MSNRSVQTRHNLDTSQVNQVEVEADRAGQRLDNFLLGIYASQIPRGHIYRLIRTGQVRVNSRRAKPKLKLCAEDVVRVPPVASESPQPVTIPDQLLEQVRAAILYRDDQQLVVDKPAGLAVHAGSGIRYGLIDVLRKLLPDYPDIALAHRLDRDTSGCLLVGLNRQALKSQQQMLKSGSMEKRYMALIQGQPAQQGFTVDLPLLKQSQGKQSRVVVADNGKSAETEFLVLERYRNCTLIQAEPITGRTHQIRVHAAHMGHPIVGDGLYNPASNKQSGAGCGRLFLHAHHLRLNWPEDILVNAPLPATLRNYLDQLPMS